MKLFFRSILLCMSALSLSLLGFSQQDTMSFEQLYDTTDVSPMKCLKDSRNFISINTLQFATGTANINYEFKCTPQFAVKLGVGTVVGTRILFNEPQLPCMFGGFYGLVEPRYYFKRASESCYIQYGLSASYKYWNFTGENLICSSEDLNKMTADERTAEKAKYSDNDTYNTNADGIYEKQNMIEHLGSISFFGKGNIVGGLTAEIEVGFGFGTKLENFYCSPNLGFSFGWTF